MMFVIYRLMILLAMSCWIGSIIIQDNVLAVKTMDKLDCQGIILQQYIKIRLERAIQQVRLVNVVGLPLEVFIYAKNLFKQESKIATLFLYMLQKEFYFKDILRLYEKIQKRPDSRFLQVLFKMSGKKLLNLSQIMIRVTFLTLYVRLRTLPGKIYRYQFKSLRTDLQIQLIINGLETISQVIIKQLLNIDKEFNHLQFYQISWSCSKQKDFDHITQWVELKLDQKGKIFQQKIDHVVPFKIQNSNQSYQFKSRKNNKRATIHEDITVNYKEQDVLKIHQPNKIIKRKKYFVLPQTNRKGQHYRITVKIQLL